MQRILALMIFVIALPLLGIMYFIVRITSKGPFIFKQKRMGRGKKIFTIYKIRTMVEDAEKLKAKYQSLNEADGPVFKIREDPRYTGAGKIISRFGLDELPQLLNIIKNEMSFVGPRPLPVEEALQVPKKYEARFSVLPGITSSWVVVGAHKLNFKQWMDLDLEYVKKKNFWYDMKIVFKTMFLILKLVFKF